MTKEDRGGTREHLTLPPVGEATPERRAQVAKAWRERDERIVVRGDIVGPFHEEWGGWDEEKNLAPHPL